MDLDRLDAVARSLAGPGSRRRLLGVLAAIPAAAGLVDFLSPEDAAAKERRRRRKQWHKKRKNPGSRKGKKTRKCKPESVAQTCAGKCGSVPNNCKQTVDCGSCACDPPCAACFTCQDGPNTPGTCVIDPTQEGQACGDPGQVCQAVGTCACDATSCSNPTPICAGGACVPCSAALPCPDGCCQADGACGATCRVFTTSSTHTGNLGGLSGGDAICQGLAGAEGLPGRYFAWLSDGTDSPSTRFPLAGDPDIGPYVLVGAPAATVAEDWDGLVNRPTCGSGACIAHPIDRDETGAAVASPLLAWTGTTRSGTSMTYTCEQWTNNTGSGPLGSTGETNKTDDRWTFSAVPPCSTSRHLFCFQQG